MQNISNPKSHEIELFELFARLWQKRLIIFSVTCIGIVLATIYAFTTKEEWTSKAQIIPPSAVQLGTYLETQRGFFRYSGGNDVNVGDSISYAHGVFLVMLNAMDNKLDYVKNSAYFKQQAMKKDDEIEREKLLLEIAEEDLQIKGTEQGVGNSFDISFSAETANNAYQTLQDYIVKTNQLVLNKLFDDLRLQIKEHILTLENSVTNIKLQTEQTRKNQILAINEAIVSANDANITEYTGQSTVAGNTIIDFSNSRNMFLLGEKYLIAQLNALESTPIIYPIEYYQTLKNITELNRLLNYEPKGMAFEYTRAPSQPVEKDKPRKGLIIILGALLGGLLGCSIVLVQSVVHNQKNISR